MPVFAAISREFSFIYGIKGAYITFHCILQGGSNPKPGEVSLAHHGVLFLDELPEFPRTALEVLREPLEVGQVEVSRVKAQVSYPARFQLIAAMNPCPCGYFGDRSGRCACTPNQLARYRDKLSGPLLDRIDMHVNLPTLPISILQDNSLGESSEAVQARVVVARERQLVRQDCANSQLKQEMLRKICILGQEERLLLEKAMQRLQLSARAYDRILRLARTIADLADSKSISVGHLSEALNYRQLDRQQSIENFD